MSALIRAGGIVYDIEAATKSDLLRAMVAHLPVPPLSDRARLLAAFEAREAKGSTGVGAGIAIPHVRDYLLLPVEVPFVTLCLVARPIDFDAIDRRPVHALFIVVSPTVPIHLRILGQLGFLLRDATLARMLERRAPADAIVQRIEEIEPKRPR